MVGPRFIVRPERNRKNLPDKNRQDFLLRIFGRFAGIKFVCRMETGNLRCMGFTRLRSLAQTFKKDETFVPEIRGKHARRYFYENDGKHFISYGKWLAAPREEKYFTGERIVFREILGKNFECTVIIEDLKIDRSLYRLLVYISHNWLCHS